MAETPLAPYHIEAHADVIDWPCGLVADAFQEFSTVRCHWVEILQGSLQDSDTFRLVSNPLPRMLAAFGNGKGSTRLSSRESFLDEGIYGLQKYDV